jgi:hypothetical protein
MQAQLMLSDVRERVSVEKLQGEHEGRDLFNSIEEQGRGATRLLQGPRGPEIVSKPLGEHDRALVRKMPLDKRIHGVKASSFTSGCK